MAKAQVKRTINASADTLWNTLRDFDLDYLNVPHELEGEEIGATRRVKMPDNSTLVEQVELFNPDTRTLGYTILVGSLPVKDYHATIHLEPTGDDETEITWSAEFEPLGAPEEKAVQIMENMFKMNLTALQKYTAS